MNSNKLKITLTLLSILILSFIVRGQDPVNTTKLKYTIQVDGLTDVEQSSRLDKTFKQKMGIISAEIDFAAKKVVVVTSDEITYLYVCDILSTEGLKSQNYIVTKE